MPDEPMNWRLTKRAKVTSRYSTVAQPTHDTNEARSVIWTRTREREKGQSVGREAAGDEDRTGTERGSTAQASVRQREEEEREERRQIPRSTARRSVEQRELAAANTLRVRVRGRSPLPLFLRAAAPRPPLHARRTA